MTDHPPPADDRPHFALEPLDDGLVFRMLRGHRLNALTRPMLAGLIDCVDRLEREGGRLLVVIGEGERAFCAGTDLAEAREMGDAAMIAKSSQARDLFLRMSVSPVVSVAALNGLAFGGGLELAMACRLRVAAPHAQAALPEIKLGLLPAYGGTQFLPALVGQARALDLMLTGRAIDAAEALAIGLYDRLAVPGQPLLAQAIAHGRAITGYSAVAIAAIRACVAAAGPTVTRAGLDVEDAQVRKVMTSEDAREGVEAFLQKRPPVFRHR
jgi:enoyl-CoA hydratase